MRQPPEIISKILNALIGIKGHDYEDVVGFILTQWVGEHLEEIQRYGITIQADAATPPSVDHTAAYLNPETHILPRDKCDICDTPFVFKNNNAGFVCLTHHTRPKRYMVMVSHGPAGQRKRIRLYNNNGQRLDTYRAATQLERRIYNKAVNMASENCQPLPPIPHTKQKTEGKKVHPQNTTADKKTWQEGGKLIIKNPGKLKFDASGKPRLQQTDPGHEAPK